MHGRRQLWDEINMARTQHPFDQDVNADRSRVPPSGDAAALPVPQVVWGTSLSHAASTPNSAYVSPQTGPHSPTVVTPTTVVNVNNGHPHPPPQFVQVHQPYHWRQHTFTIVAIVLVIVGIIIAAFVSIGVGIALLVIGMISFTAPFLHTRILKQRAINNARFAPTPTYVMPQNGTPVGGGHFLANAAVHYPRQPYVPPLALGVPPPQYPLQPPPYSEVCNYPVGNPAGHDARNCSPPPSYRSVANDGS